MFDQLFKRPLMLACYRTSPLLKERLAYLRHLANQGYARETLRNTAQDQLVILKLLGFDRRPHKTVTLDEIKRKTSRRKHYLFAVRWLRFMGRLKKPRVPVTPLAKKIKAFANYMEHEAELSSVTVCGRCWQVKMFFKQLRVQDGSLHAMTPHRIDTAFQKMLASGDYAQRSIRILADSLRAFFRFAETRGWCRKGLAESIRVPRVFSQASLPMGPSWDDVQRLLAMAEGDRRDDIRDRPILMLFAIYGLRRKEVSRLRLEDIDWEREEFRIVSSKSEQVRIYPLTWIVGGAILRYLREVRPRSPHREVFLTLPPPFRPLVHSAIGALVHKRLRALNVSLHHYGPHALRYACATRLLATGLSLKEIGDHLGHLHPNSTRVYAKVDLAGLRQVADFELGDVQ